MLFYCRKRMAVGVLAVLAAAVLFFFRDQLLLGFQLWRLESLDCTKPVGDEFRNADRTVPCPKFWAHRVNSMERFNKLGSFFAGMETDVVFDAATGTFDVHHPPAGPSGLLVDSFFASLSGTALRLWIDLKDLPAGEMSAALEAFAAYDRQYGIRENIVVESSLPEFVNALAEKGFRTSFLVPPVYLGEENNRNRGEDSQPPPPPLSPRVAYVSQDASYLERLKELYPGRKIITWSLAFYNYIDRNALRSLASDTAVEVILLNVKTRPYR